jgi:(1->4)-alpha-D-glucan 1-alpha-D-glucosylmutase
MTARIPASTYRLQFHGGFGFRDAAALIPYLHRLGVDACYTSPYLKATPGTRHGYDICDHNALNPELGDEGDYEAFVAAAGARGMGQVLDFVPNHMGIDPRTNAWWHDVLENGPSSPFADYFDIDWEPVTSSMREKVLLPVLGDQYGLELERGRLQLAFEEATLRLRYFDHEFPINPRQAPRCLGLDLDRLRATLGDDDPDLREFLSILTALQNLPPYTERSAGRIQERRREKEVARERLARLVAASPPVAAHIDAAVARFNGAPGTPASSDLMHDLLEAQAWRLAYWRTAVDEINYRRFFDINELAALRMEDPRVFAATHGLLARLLSSGAVTGLRIDHPDGLFDPAGYFEDLQGLARSAAGAPAEHDDRPLYVLAEKILEPGEPLPDWAIHGTTGYDVLTLLNGLFVDAANLPALRRICSRFTHRHLTFADEAWEGKRVIMQSSMSSELNVLSQALYDLAQRDRRTRDFTLTALRLALMQTVASFPVYRTYLRPGSVRGADRAAIETAIDDALRRNPGGERTVFDFLRRVLLPEPDDDPAADLEAFAEAATRMAFAMRVQQFTGPVQAKGVEDTAFYRHNVLLSLNEVGGAPEGGGVSVEAFHAAAAERHARWPYAMTATATHDTKRGEDARARLNVISEVPQAWHEAVSAWRRLNAGQRAVVGGAPAPDRVDEYHFYQALLAAWPVEPDAGPGDTAARDRLAGRLAEYMIKAIREAKRHTSWLWQDSDYEEAVVRFVRELLAGEHASRFLPSFLQFERRVARAGAVNALAQLVLKIGLPGVPDIYQGTEFWSTTLVDPDNRRPVDFDERRAALDALEPALMRLAAGEDVSRDVAALLDRWHDGHVKLWVTACGLRSRRAAAGLFLDGTYVPLAADGPRAAHVVAFARRHGEREVIVLAPRHPAALIASERPWPTGVNAWLTTVVACPSPPAGPLHNLLTGERVEAVASPHGPALPVCHALRSFPVALLASVPHGARSAE